MLSKGVEHWLQVEVGNATFRHDVLPQVRGHNAKNCSLANQDKPTKQVNCSSFSLPHDSQSCPGNRRGVVGDNLRHKRRHKRGP
jgi:hypothetical protein